MDARTGGAADDVRRWVEAWAEHVRKRFGSRAVVSARVAGEAPVVLSQVFALEGGGLVLVVPCDHEGHDHGAHDHGAHDDGGHEDAGHEHAGHEHGAHEQETHPHGDGEGCCGDCEVWLSSPGQVVFEARAAHEGAWCTGFGVLGLSRTPHVLVARGTVAPPKRGHDHGEF